MKRCLSSNIDGPKKLLPPEVLPYVSHIGMCRPKGEGFAPFSSNRVWFSREPRECMNVYSLSFK